LRYPASASGGAGSGPGQGTRYLGLQRGLQQQPRPEPSDLLDHLTQVTGRVGEQLVDLGADALNG
jgi:hypothetical protein